MRERKHNLLSNDPRARPPLMSHGGAREKNKAENLTTLEWKTRKTKR